MVPDPPDFVRFALAPSELSAGAVVAILEAAGVYTVTRRYDDGGPRHPIALTSQTFFPTEILIPRNQLDLARRTIAARRQESLDIDWNEVDVGEPEPTPQSDYVPDHDSMLRITLTLFALLILALPLLAAARLVLEKLGG